MEIRINDGLLRKYFTPEEMLFLKESGRLMKKYDENGKDLDANYEEFITELSKKLEYKNQDKVRNEFLRIEAKIRELPTVCQILSSSRGNTAS